MIKTRELRIGNKILVGKSEVSEVISVMRHGVYVAGDNTAIPDEHLQPIPLDQSILEACGFEKDGFGAFNYSISPFVGQLKQLSFSGDYLYLRQGDLEKNRINDHIVVLWNKDLKKQFYLHDLQNLIHSLTGQELAIDSTTISQTSKIV